VAKRRQPQLSLGPGGWVNAVTLVALGLVVAGFAAGLRRVPASDAGTRWTSRLLLATGTAFAAVGISPIDPGLGYPPGAPALHSLHGLVHALATLVLFGCLAAACLVQAARPARSGTGWVWAAGSAGAGVAVAACILATFVIVTVDPLGTGPAAWAGLVQRAAIVGGLAWITLLALRLLLVAPGGRAGDLGDAASSSCAAPAGQLGISTERATSPASRASYASLTRSSG